jgi:regulator of protease activity HflC (stomatin/prohibitin superfamily)
VSELAPLVYQRDVLREPMFDAGETQETPSGAIAHRHNSPYGVPVTDHNGVHGDSNMNPITAFLVFAFSLAGVAIGYWVNPYLALVFFAAAATIAMSLKMANVWQKFVILRMGKLQSVKGAGMFAIIPVLDNVVAVIDERIQTTAFNAEQALTKDTVPVNVDAIIFWHVHDAEKAALAITNYREAIERVAQTSLREMIGYSMLAALLSDRKEADEQLKLEIGAKTAPWGISVSSVEIRDVAIPEALQDAMSRQAQAEREKQARVILGSAEAAIAGKFVEAADTYAGHPVALQLRAMNIIYETTKERGATILMPTSMVDSLNPSTTTLAALALASKGVLEPELTRRPVAALSQ